MIYETPFPLGHPTLTVHNKRLDPPWASSWDNPHRGLIKCIVEPPDSIKIPVLPHKFDERLLVRKIFVVNF